MRRTIELKCQVIDIDPKEKREAVVLVYGHTLGHPIEAISPSDQGVYVACRTGRRWLLAASWPLASP